MYIAKVLSYNGAWELIKTKHFDLLTEFTNAINWDIEGIKHRYIDNNEIDPAIRRDRLRHNAYYDISLRIRHRLRRMEWVPCETDISYIDSLGHIKNKVAIKTSISKNEFLSWLMIVANSAFEIKKLDVAMVVCADKVAKKIQNENNHNNFDEIIELLESINGNFTAFPFVIIELEAQEVNVEVLDKSNIEKIDRCITFEPEYYQAGLGILSYFGTILRDKYPDQNATVKIEQHDLTVRMIIETEDGNIETLEKALHEYELVLKGQKSADEFYLSPVKALELKNQLNIFKFQVDSQKEIIALQRGHILSLEDIVDKALAPITHPPVTIINQLNNTQTTHINHQKELNQSYDDLDKLIDLADKDSLKKRLERALTAIDIAQNLDDPDEVKNSGGMKQLAKILNESNEVGSEINSLAEKGEQAVELIKNLGRKYNSVAEWCGLPVIPSVFVKE